ncbi:hypothetical protein [Mesorhizobium sp. WSM3626]|uniref:hypothetical protein n=1 Tax=Mesorhizobium sp. WSM3626 TaxID=1040987 RepID=UPI0012EC9902|nr:hypothetical protein [Mesorhizobium sp. WSM3626]
MNMLLPTSRSKAMQPCKESVVREVMKGQKFGEKSDSIPLRTRQTGQARNSCANQLLYACRVFDPDGAADQAAIPDARLGLIQASNRLIPERENP